VIYCEEEAVNLASYDRPISWNEHVTFGPPFLEAGVTWFDMPATRSKVCPASYSPRFNLQPNAEFAWPNAPTQDRDSINLRTTPAQQFGHYTAQLLNSELEFGFIAACNPRLKLLVVYVFRRADFPWVGNWEERYNRSQAPWRGKRSAGDWSSAQLLSLYRDAKPSIKARCLEKKLIVGLLLSLRQTFDI
jgi:hypothetical protein